MRKFLSNPVVKLLASIALLLIAARVLNWRDLAASVARLDLAHLVVAFAAAMMVLVFLALRWAMMAREIDTGVTLRHVRNFLFAICISSVTPANIGADLYRFATLRRDGKGWDVVGLLVQEKVLLLVGYLIGLAATVALLGFEGDLSRDGNWWLLLPAGLAAALAATTPFLLPPVIGVLARHHLLAGRPAHWLDRLLRLVALGTPRRYLPLLALSLLSIGSWLVTVAAVAARIDPALPLPLLWFIAIVADIARWAPISLQGIGVREGAFAAMFLFFGADPAQGFALGGIAYLLVTLAMLAAGGVALLIDLVMAVTAGRTSAPRS